MLWWHIILTTQWFYLRFISHSQDFWCKSGDSWDNFVQGSRSLPSSCFAFSKSGLYGFCRRTWHASPPLISCWPEPSLTAHLTTEETRNCLPCAQAQEMMQWMCAICLLHSRVIISTERIPKKRLANFKCEFSQFQETSRMVHLI